MSNEFLKNSFVSRPRTTEEIRDLIRCPQLGSEDYGKWGALPLEVRFTLHNLVVSLDNERFCCEKLQQRIDKANEYIKRELKEFYDKNKNCKYLTTILELESIEEILGGLNENNKSNRFTK